MPPLTLQNVTVSVFGLGYVGSVSAACLAATGARVVGADTQQVKVDLINQGRSPVIEARLPEMMAEAVAAGRLRATTSAEDAVADSDISLICVGTPSRPNGSLNTDMLERVCQQIGAVLRRLDKPHLVVIRSTILPGTMRSLVIPVLEESTGRTLGDRLWIANNPEFLRESTAVADFFAPPKTVIGAIDEATADKVAALYAGIDAPLIRTSLEVAETVKYTDNIWHALKVAFGNEIGNVCKAVGVDSHAIMDIFFRDEKLNISKAYLRPGFAFGGSCLPKDLRAMLFHAKRLDLDLPLLQSILPSNRMQIDRAVQVVIDRGRRDVGILGLSFKGGTDDLRESPMVELVERLLGKGFSLRIYDGSVNLARLVGANREYIMTAVPHLASLMVGSLDDVLAVSDVVVVGNRDPAFDEVPARIKPHQHLIDMVRLPNHSLTNGGYDGINW